MMHGQKNIKIC